MKKSNLKKKLVLAMSVVMIFGCVNVPSYAITNGWRNATELTGGKVQDDAITSATDENWYKFTTTVANTICNIGLYDEPTVNAYNIELRYQETAGTRPIILENTTYTTAKNKSYIRATLENIGTYYVRVYSLTGEYSEEPYTLSTSTNTVGCSGYVSEVYCDGQNYDWAACAEMLGKKYYDNVFGTDLTTRNYKNAARFVQSSGADDDANSATATRNSLANTALAANYIFAGDYMATPVFEVTNSLVTLSDFQKYIWVMNGQRGLLPAIIRTRYAGLDDDNIARYLLVNGVDLEDEALKVVDPDITGTQYVRWTSMMFTYNNYQYNNEAIVLA